MRKIITDILREGTCEKTIYRLEDTPEEHSTEKKKKNRKKVKTCGEEKNT